MHLFIPFVAFDALVVVVWRCSGPAAEVCHAPNYLVRCHLVRSRDRPVNVQSATEDHSVRFHQYHLEGMGSLGGGMVMRHNMRGISAAQRR
jgi:hypothetical protein